MKYSKKLKGLECCLNCEMNFMDKDENNNYIRVCVESNEVITDCTTINECYHSGFGGSHYNFNTGKYNDEEEDKRSIKYLTKQKTSKKNKSYVK